MPRTFLLPDLGEGLTEADLVRWLVAEGDEVAVDQPVVEVETAKSLVEVPCPWAGVVVQLHGQAGETLQTGQPLISVDTGQEGSGNVLIGYGTSQEQDTGRRRRRRRTADAEAAARQAHERMAEAPRLAPKVTSPLVRNLAREHGVHVGELTGSGPGGLIMRRDVLEAIESSPVSTDSTSATGSAGDPLPIPETGTSESVDPRTGLPVAGRQRITGIRKAIAETMVRSRREIPEATVWMDVDVTGLMDLRARLKERRGHAPGLMAFMARFALAGLVEFPELNVRVDPAPEEPDGQEIVGFGDVNLGFAAQTDRGLVVPVVRNAQGRSAEALQEQFRDLAQTAREGKATAAQLSGSTFTINNYGVFGTDGATPIINHPEAAILGMGRVISRPWVVDEQLAVRKIMVLTLAFDHRVCDGASAGGFLRFVADCAEDPESAVAML